MADDIFEPTAEQIAEAAAKIREKNPAQPDRFQSIFHCLWWAIVTLTTVGYGDVYPITIGGKIFTGIILLVGFGSCEEGLLKGYPQPRLASDTLSFCDTATKQIDTS